MWHRPGGFHTTQSSAAEGLITSEELYLLGILLKGKLNYYFSFICPDQVSVLENQNNDNNNNNNDDDKYSGRQVYNTISISMSWKR